MSECAPREQVVWLFAAQAAEIVTAGVADNIEQHQRRKHNELDNILQIRSWVGGVGGDQG